MDDLVTWLRAQLDEDERTARSFGDDLNSKARNGIESVSWTGVVEYLEHFSAFRTYAEVEAKRQILDDHDPDWPRLECPTCCGYDGNDNYGVERRPREAYPCRVVRRLALPYADQLGYREEWRP